MLHEPAVEAGVDYAAEYKMRLGVRMFVVYSIFYAGFVALNVLSPVLMEKTIVFGLNLACAYGFSLIIVALIMALIYNALCGRQESLLTAEANAGSAAEQPSNGSDQDSEKGTH